jgi:hypothetical protein
MPTYPSVPVRSNLRDHLPESLRGAASNACPAGCAARPVERSRRTPTNLTPTPDTLPYRSPSCASPTAGPQDTHSAPDKQATGTSKPPPTAATTHFIGRHRNKRLGPRQGLQLRKRRVCLAPKDDPNCHRMAADAKMLGAVVSVFARVRSFGDLHVEGSQLPASTLQAS